jgi:hypothetical protein
VNAEKSYSFSSPDNNTLRFEVRKGDQFSDSGWTDPIGKERSEIAEAARHPLSDEVRIEYQFMIEPGPTNTAKWLVMGQLHSNVGWSPPFEMQLTGDKLKIFANHEANGIPISLVRVRKSAGVCTPMLAGLEDFQPDLQEGYLQ